MMVCRSKMVPIFDYEGSSGSKCLRNSQVACCYGRKNRAPAFIPTVMRKSELHFCAVMRVSDMHLDPPS
jgi:hypothetical protein